MELGETKPLLQANRGPRNLWTDPVSIDVERLEAAAVGDGSAPRIQFSRAATCTPHVLAELDRYCQRFGARIIVRFFGFYNEEFGAEILRSLPSVRALYIDVRRARNLDYLDQLEHLEEFGIGVHEGDNPQILRCRGIQSVERLVLIDNRRNNVDLAPLSAFRNLVDLHLCGHAHNIDVLGQLTGIRRLALNKMSEAVRFGWIQSIAGLRDLTILLGSRNDLDEVSHPDLERLRIDRIRDLDRIDLAAFPLLRHFHMEDQSKVKSLELSPLRSTLCWMTVWNCKTLGRLSGTEQLNALQFLWIGKTKVDPEEFVKTLPTCLRQLTISGYGKRRDAAIRALIEARGVAPAAYVG